MVERGRNAGTINQFKDETGFAFQLGNCPEDGVPADGAFADSPVTVSVTIGILNVDMLQHVARRPYEIVDGLCSIVTVGDMGMAVSTESLKAGLLNPSTRVRRSSGSTSQIFSRTSVTPIVSARLTTASNVAWVASMIASRDCLKLRKF